MVGCSFAGFLRSGHHPTVLSRLVSLMNLIIFAIVVTGILLLIYLLARSDHDKNREALQEEIRWRSKDESHQGANETSILSADADSWLTQQPESNPEPMENVTSSPKRSAEQSSCPACGAAITASDERCTSCEISFVTDGTSFITDSLQKWALRTVGPADGIFRPPTEFRE